LIRQCGPLVLESTIHFGPSSDREHSLESLLLVETGVVGRDNLARVLREASHLAEQNCFVSVAYSTPEIDAAPALVSSALFYQTA
jgi:hypothetical protein